jgi:hypothetical protein
MGLGARDELVGRPIRPAEVKAPDQLLRDHDRHHLRVED